MAASALSSSSRLPAAVANSSLAADVVRVAASLALVVGLILLLAWLSRRLQANQRLRHFSQGRRLQCVESLNLGLKERLLLVRVDQQELLIAASPQGLRTLHVLTARDPASPKPPPPASTTANPGFAGLLQRLRGGA